jgi:butyrate kinase
MKKPRIGVINPGSTTTKLGYFEGNTPLEIRQINHLEHPEWNRMPEDARFTIRLQAAENFFRNKPLDLIMSRGGILKPLPSGVYEINDKMLKDLRHAPMKHASNWGAPIARRIADKNNIPAYIADPVTVDELDEPAKYSGHPLFPRKSIFHALNHKAVGRKFAEETGRKYEDLNLIVIHLGGGISIGAHRKGKVVDVNQALDGEGPFSPERSGTLPAGDLVRTAFSGKFNERQMLRMITGEGGLKAYLGTADVKKIIERNHPGELKILQAMIYQIIKYTGEMWFVLQGKVDAILLTGGLAYADYITEKIQEKLKFLNCPVKIYPGENELNALAYNGFLIYTEKIQPLTYT